METLAKDAMEAAEATRDEALGAVGRLGTEVDVLKNAIYAELSILDGRVISLWRWLALAGLAILLVALALVVR